MSVFCKAVSRGGLAIKKKIDTHVGKDDTAPDHCFRRQRNFRRQNGDANLALDFPVKLLFTIDS